MKINIKEATKEEINKLETELNENLYFKKYLHFHPSDYSFAKNLSSDNHGFRDKWFSIFKDKTIVGLIQMARQDNRERILFSVLIFKEFQRKGYGLKALKEFFQLCKRIGIKSIECHTTNKKLVSLYTIKMKMRKVGVFKKSKKLLDGKVYDEIMFEKILK